LGTALTHGTATPKSPAAVCCSCATSARLVPVAPWEPAIPTLTWEELDLQPKRLLDDARRARGFASAFLATQTGYGQDDLALPWVPLSQIFEHDRSASRGRMATRGLCVLEHPGEPGNAHAQDLFDRLVINPKTGRQGPARDIGAYLIEFDGKPLIAGETLDAAPGVKLTRRC